MDNSQGANVIILVIFIAVLLGFFLLFLFLIFVKRKNQVITEKEQAELHFKEELIKTQTEIQKETMSHIGREIHDNVGQKLTLSSLYLQQFLLDENDPKKEEEIRRIGNVINDSLQELRHLSKSLTEDAIHQHSISELIQKESQKVESLKRCTINFEVVPKIDISSYQVKSVLLRITQEFLQNSVKHSECKTIDIQLSQEEKTIHLTLRDDGVGFDPNKLKSNGIGLKNMRKRTEMIQGIFILNSEKGEGTQLTLKIPNS